MAAATGSIDADAPSNSNNSGSNEDRRNRVNKHSQYYMALRVDEMELLHCYCNA